jgi:hypothetical protein
MKILIVGSLRPPEENNKPYANPEEAKKVEEEKKFVNDNLKRFQAASMALGAALASKGHTIMVGVPNWGMLRELNTVATFVVEGANQAAEKDNKNYELIFYGPREREPENTTPEIDSYKDLRDTCTKLNIKEKVVGSGSSKASTIPNVTAVDAVMLIAGRDGTENIGYAAYSMDKPVIALRSFGGAAEDFSKEVLNDDYKRFLAQDDNTGEDLRAMDVVWEEKLEQNFLKANAIVETTEKIVTTYYKPQEETRKVQDSIVIGIVVLILAWVVFFLSGSHDAAQETPNNFDVQVSFFLLLYISALLGAGVRILVRYQRNQIAQLTLRGLGIDAAITLVIAFGLALIYLIGGISFTGDVVILDSTATGESPAFTTVAISMSLLGLAGGYLVPINQLTQRLENIIAQ